MKVIKLLLPTLNPFTPKILIIDNSPFYLLHISQEIGSENLVFDKEKNSYLMSLSIFITCLLYNVWILSGEVMN